MVWKNGQIPESDLVVFRRGRDRDGEWFWALTPATLARHNALVARALARTGRTLTPGEGFSTYRPIPAQRKARERYGNGAAVVGTSSHGGFWEKQETLAIDYDNWAWVYENHGGRAAFYEDCRAVGLTPGMIEPSRGYPDEPWHVIDLNPRGPVPAFDNVKPFEEDDMFTDEDRARQQRIEENQKAILTRLGGDLSSEDQVDLYQDVQVIRARVEGDLGSQEQSDMYNNVRAIRERVDPHFEPPGVVTAAPVETPRGAV